MDRLYLYINPEGVSAWHADVSGCREEFSVSRHLSADSGLRHIEDIIYDHPDIIDDFHVTVFADFGRSFLLPDDYENFLEESVEIMFPDSGMDKIVTKCGEYCLVNLLPYGVKSFLERTFPGVILQHPTVPLIEKFRKNPEGGCRIYLHRQGEYSYLVAFSREKLLWLSTHVTVENADAAYYLLEVWNILGFKADDAKLFISGPRSMKEELLPLMRRHIEQVVTYRKPDNYPENAPLAVSLAETGYKMSLKSK